MKRCFKIMSLMLTALCLTGCFSVLSSSKNSSSNSSNYYSSSDVDDGTTWEIERVKNNMIVDYEYIFTNGGFREFELVCRDRNGQKIDFERSVVEWRVKSEDSDIIGVDSFGTVTAKKNGTGTLIAQYQNHIAEKELKVATIAKTFEKNEGNVEFRIGKTYSLPLNIEPKEATLFISTSNNDVITFSGNTSSFKVNQAGEVDVSVTAYTDWMGNKTTHNFKIVTTDPSAPVFVYKNQNVLSAEVTFAQNKYKTLDLGKLGITAKSSIGDNLNSYVTVSGNYDLSKVGTYTVKLSVADPYNTSAVATCDLTMIVTEYETVTYTTDNFTRFNLDNTEYEFIAESPYSLAVAGVKFTSKVTLLPKYHHAVGTLSWRIYFSIENWGGYRKHDYYGDALTRTYNWREDGSLTLELNYTFNPGESLKKESFEFGGGAISFAGTVYEYKYY